MSRCFCSRAYWRHGVRKLGSLSRIGRLSTRYFPGMLEEGTGLASFARISQGKAHLTEVSTSIDLRFSQTTVSVQTLCTLRP